MYVCVWGRNLKLLSEVLSSSVTPPDLLINITDVDSVSVEMYKNWYDVQGSQLNLTGYIISNCSVENTMKQVRIDFISIYTQYVQ